MKCNYFFLIFVGFCFFNVTKLSTPDIYCYVCEGKECEHINKDMLEYCGPERDKTTETVTTTMPTPTGETIIHSTTSLPQTPPTTSPAGENTTILFTAETTTISTTEINNTESSTEESTTLPSTIETSTAPSNSPPTAISSNVSTNLSTEALTHIATTTTEAATVSPVVIDSTSLSIDNSTSILQTTHPALLTGELSTISTKPLNTSSSTGRTLSRIRKFVTSKRDDTHDFLVNNFRGMAQRTAGDGTRYACYSISLPENDYKIKRKHGCAQIPHGQSACEAVRNENNLTQDEETIIPDGCRYCLTSECNNGSTMRLPLIVLLATLAINYAMRI